MRRKIGDFPAWAIVLPFAPPILCVWLGLGYAGSFLVYIVITFMLAALVQLDRLEMWLKQLNDRPGAGRSDG